MEESYELRPKFTVAELKVILEGLEKAGFHEMAGNPRYRLFRRISELSKGRNVRKGRIWNLDQVQEADRLDEEVKKALRTAGICEKCGGPLKDVELFPDTAGKECTQCGEIYEEES